MKIKILLIICLLITIACAQEQEQDFFISTPYGFNTLGGNEDWIHYHKSASPVEFNYPSGDTLYVTYGKGRKSERIKTFVKRRTNQFDNEPKVLNGHPLIGVFNAPKETRGLIALIYAKKEQGVLIKYFHAPGQMFISMYHSINKENPFKNMPIPVSTDAKVKMKLNK